MGQMVSVPAARARLGDVMRRVLEHDETILVEHGGQARVVMLSVAEYERLRQGEAKPKLEDWRMKLAQTHELILQEGGEHLAPPAEEMIRQGREERDERILDLR